MKNDSIDVLKMRLGIARYAIRVLEEQGSNDPRQPETIKYYQGQLSRIEEQIREKFPEQADVLLSEGSIPDGITINLKPGIVFPKSENPGG